MAQNTAITWTDHTFNIAWGCEKISDGCKFCYAKDLAERWGFDVWGKRPRRTFGETHWSEPLRWNLAAQKQSKPAKVFCSSMCDIGEDHPTIIAELEKLWPLIKRTPWLTWQLLTKRPERYKFILPWGDYDDPWPNVWLGTSIENQECAWRANFLRTVPAAIRFISYEPALSALELDLHGIHWVIYGGESGPNFRQDTFTWATWMHRQCQDAGVAFFHKQDANRRPGHRNVATNNLPQDFPKHPEPPYIT